MQKEFSLSIHIRACAGGLKIAKNNVTFFR